jgi:hypothetical protein
MSTPRLHRWWPLALLVALLLGRPASLSAHSAPQIGPVRIGLPAGKGGQDTGRSRNGFWAPVYITLKAGGDGNPQGAYRLAVETRDLEDSLCRTTAPVPALQGEEERAVLAYAVPGAEGAEFTVKLETTEGRVLQTVARLSRDLGQDTVVTPSQVLFFAAGPGLSQLQRAGEKLDRAEQKNEEDQDRTRRQFANALTVAALPDRWFGYDAVDVVVLGTGKKDFVEQLTQESGAARRNALVEWVRRGGILVVSVGRNQQFAARLFDKMQLLDCAVTGSSLIPSLPNLSGWCERLRGPLQDVELATLAPRRGAHVLVSEKDRPVLVQGSCGLGRVVLVAFDLDSPPFTTWAGQADFWRKLQSALVPVLPAGRAPAGGANRRIAAPEGAAVFDTGEDPELRTGLKRGLESFEAVPVVSFGWVALFILFYIALVGPLDYFVLKKVFKRLELTWVTFPATVLLVSVLAYATAYALKGDELRVNKIDIVEIDLHQPRQVYGRTWFTVFSPRVQSYTLGLEPAPGWAGRSAGPSGTVLTVLEGSDRGLRTGSQGLFPRPYEYAEDASGLVRVPLRVWATRSFSASWRAPIKPDEPPIDTREVGQRGAAGPLRTSRTGEGLVGRITNNLPVDLLGVALLYREKWYDLGTLAAGESRRVEELFARAAKGQGRTLSQWFEDSALAPGAPIAPSGRALNVNFLAGRSAHRLVKPILFNKASGSPDLLNSGLRHLDQSWRVLAQPTHPAGEQRYRDEAILVARAPMLSDRAEAVTEHGASPSRLWLGALPGEGERPALPGYLTQETYVRVYIPVQPAAR